MSFPYCLWLLTPGAELSGAEVCAAGPFPGHVCQPCCGTRRQPDHKGPVCPMMKSWLFILWVVQNHCVQQMAELTAFLGRPCGTHAENGFQRRGQQSGPE